MHPAHEKRAKPLQLDQLEALVQWLETQLAQALETDDRAGVLIHTRNKALVLLGFWRGFRSDELRRLQIEHIEVSPG